MLETWFNQLAALICSGNTLEALQQFYDSGVQVTEADGQTRTGLAANLANEQANLAAVKSVEAVLLSYAVNTGQNRVLAEWQFTFTNRNNETFRLKEVAVQEWQQGKIVAERFYYKNFEKL